MANALRQLIGETESETVLEPRTGDVRIRIGADFPARGSVAPGRPGGYRPDIEGLRAVAVVLVLLAHTVLVPAGGFLGVDVFFVISGFLITGLLMREYRRTGSFSFAQFYARRVRRILPAAIVVLIVTVGVGFLLLSRPKAESVAVDGVWSLLFAENWHLIAQGTDYFQASAAISPLQHYWSLAVEEQYYLLWPLLLLLLLTIAAARARRRGTAAARTVTAALAVAVAASFVWSAVFAFTAPTFAYFDTLGRVWELGAGALIAASAAAWAQLPSWSRPVLAWLGLAVLIVAAVLTSPAMPLPAPTALVAVAGAGLVIAAGIGGQRGLWPLTNPVTRYIGRISFSLYLWHFPVVIYSRIVFGADNPLVAPLALALTVVLSVASYHLVEEPFRTMRRRTVKSTSSSRPSAETTTKLNRRKLSYGALTVGTAATVALVILALLRVGPVAATPALAGAATPAPGASAATPADGTGALDARAQQIQTALRDTAWPELSPSVAQFGENGRDVVATEWEVDGCLGLDGAQVDDPRSNAQRCTYGNLQADAAHTAVVYGDSVAISYVPMVRAALGDQWAVKVFTVAGCPVSDTPVIKVGGGDYPECGDFRAWAQTQIRTLSPALVFIAEATDNSRLASKAEGDAAVAEWTDATRKSLENLQGSASHIVVMTRPSTGVSLYDCQTPSSTPQSCIASVDLGFDRRAVALRDVVSDLGDGFTLINTLAWFCSQGQCPSYIGTTPVLADGIHLTAAESAASAPLLAEELQPLLGTGS